MHGCDGHPVHDQQVLSRRSLGATTVVAKLLCFPPSCEWCHCYCCCYCFWICGFTSTTAAGARGAHPSSHVLKHALACSPRCPRPYSYAALLYMMMADQSGSDETTAPRVAAAAMHAVSAAGGSRLTADPEAMQVCSTSLLLWCVRYFSAYYGVYSTCCGLVF